MIVKGRKVMSSVSTTFKVHYNQQETYQEMR